MTASLPRLLVLCCTTAVLLAASVPRTELPARGAIAIAAAQRITIDPGTGLAIAPDQAGAIPAPADVAVESAALVPGEVNEVHLPDGTVGVRVAKRYFHTIVVCRQADGSFSSDCPPAGLRSTP